MPDHPRPLHKHKAFWDQAARDHVLIAILDSPETRDPETAQESFDAAGSEAARSLLGFVHPDARVVDLGCGIGRVLRPLAAHCKEIVGVDISSEMLEQAESYLSGVQNVQLVRTPGRTLPGEDGSVDFVYSLLCLIHVDRRSTFRYLGEIKRVLRPNGVAYLQFQDITTEPGLQKFLDVVDHDYPLEFYTVPEIRQFLQANGLDALTIEAAREYVLVTAVPGAAADWCERFRQQVRVLGFEARGAFAGDRFDADQDGEFEALVEVVAGMPLSVRLVLALGVHIRVDGFVPLPSNGKVVLRFRYCAGEPGRLVVSADDAEVKELRFVARQPLPAGPATLCAGMLPPGHGWDETAIKRFPDFFLVQEVQVPRTVHFQAGEA